MKKQIKCNDAERANGAFLKKAICFLLFCTVFFFTIEVSAVRDPIGHEYAGGWVFHHAEANSQGAVTQFNSVEEFYNFYDFRSIPVEIFFWGAYQASIFTYNFGGDVIASIFLGENLDFRTVDIPYGDEIEVTRENVESFPVLYPVYDYALVAPNTMRLKCTYNYYEPSSQSYIDGEVTIYYQKTDSNY